ncbi:type I glyceraldehyde-3-phosphate dehydrogenase [Candidatus Daviesbacteria bacterium]|nr:type I glyceraldehyde-3-phosphate dehydrogenase [Candidatus Daviesbacteria bacterium]
MLRVAINGFGRIGRNAFKVALEEHPQDLEIVAINDLTSPQVLAHLLKYDTAYGQWGKEVTFDDQNIIIENLPPVLPDGSQGLPDGSQGRQAKIPVYAEKEPAKLPWRNLNIDVVIESTGRFTDEEGMKQHLLAGAKKVILSAPAKGGTIGTFLVGVNSEDYKGENLINNASCTTNCIAPVAAIIQAKFGIKKALMTTIHSVTAEQNLIDGPPPGGKSDDLRRARAAYSNIIPTTTGAAISTTEAIPALKGLFDGRAIRVPTIVGSISDFTFLLDQKVTVEVVNQAIKEACEEPLWKGIVAWTEEPFVSSDIVGRSESAIVDLSLTQVVDGDLLKIFAWYDNEWGYANRLVELVINIGKTLQQTTP